MSILENNTSNDSAAEDVWLNASGKLEINNGVRIVFSDDFNKYYKWLVEKYFYNTIKYLLPKHKGHVTIINPSLHGKFDDEELKKVLAVYLDKDLPFSYSINAYISRVNVWYPVKTPIVKEIRGILGIPEDPNDFGPHSTVANCKSNRLTSKED